MIFSPSEILPIVEATGFKADIIEKVHQLLNLLNKLKSHPFLKGKFALKGDSALNLFVFNIPRLSVDIDLNYIGAIERKKMLADRPKFEKAVEILSAAQGRIVRPGGDRKVCGTDPAADKYPALAGNDFEFASAWLLRCQGHSDFRYP